MTIALQPSCPLKDGVLCPIKCFLGYYGGSFSGLIHEKRVACLVGKLKVTFGA